MKRQGDLLITSIQYLPEGVIPKGDRVLAEGEVTGHLHELTGGDVYTKKDRLFFNVIKGCEVTLVHPEHAPIIFIPGIYEVTRQREYRPEGWRYVSD